MLATVTTMTDQVGDQGGAERARLGGAGTAGRCRAASARAGRHGAGGHRQCGPAGERPGGPRLRDLHQAGLPGDRARRRRRRRPSAHGHRRLQRPPVRHAAPAHPGGARAPRVAGPALLALPADRRIRRCAAGTVPGETSTAGGERGGGKDPRPWRGTGLRSGGRPLPARGRLPRDHQRPPVHRQRLLRLHVLPGQRRLRVGPAAGVAPGRRPVQPARASSATRGSRGCSPPCRASPTVPRAATRTPSC